MGTTALRRCGARRDPDLVVLMLHGGQQESHEPVLRRHASWGRMAVMQSQLSRWSKRRRIALWLLKYRVRGWNETAGSEPDPAVDAHDALAVIRAAHPGVQIVLVGHSMGGRTACRVADADDVAGVVALAPWLPEGEPVDALDGRVLHVIHGSRDTWTSGEWSRDFVRRATAGAERATWSSLQNAGHFMLRDVGQWNAFVRQSVLDAVRAPRARGEQQ